MTRQLLNDDLHSDSDRHRMRKICKQNPNVTIHRLRRAATAAFFAVLCLLALASTAARADGTVGGEGSFHVQNTNTSRGPCPRDNARYNLHGPLLRPPP